MVYIHRLYLRNVRFSLSITHLCVAGLLAGGELIVVTGRGVLLGDNMTSLEIVQE